MCALCTELLAWSFQLLINTNLLQTKIVMLKTLSMLICVGILPIISMINSIYHANNW